MPRHSRPQPWELSANWPDVAVSDSAGEVARLLAVNLRKAMGGRSARAVAAETGVDHTLIGKVLNGKTWADLATVARLEDALGVDLWPRRTDRSNSVS